MARADFSKLEAYIPDEESRENFRRLMAYKDNLAAEDELAKIIETMGIFAMIANTIPARLVESSAELNATLEKALRIPEETGKALTDFQLNNDRLENAAVILAEQAQKLTVKFDKLTGAIILVLMAIGFIGGMWFQAVIR